MHGDFLLGAGFLLAALAVAGVFFMRLRQSAIPAFIILGVLLRPEHFDSEMVDSLATAGVVLLLFSMGLEFSLGALVSNARRITRSGGIDLLVCFPIGIAAGLLVGGGWVGALLFAGAFYVSSSAIIAKSIIELRRAADPETEVALGILVFEDLFIALYLAVLEWVYDEIRSQERKLNLQGLPPERAIRKLIEASFDHLAAHPDFIVLLNDENRGGARHVRGSKRLEAMHSPLVSLVSRILSEGVRAGVFRRGVNPVHLYISIAGLSYFFFSNTPTLSAIFGKDLSSAAARRARRRHVVDLVLQALRP